MKFIIIFLILFIFALFIKIPIANAYKKDIPRGSHKSSAKQVKRLKTSPDTCMLSKHSDAARGLGEMFARNDGVSEKYIFERTLTEPTYHVRFKSLRMNNLCMTRQVHINCLHRFYEKTIKKNLFKYYKRSLAFCEKFTNANVSYIDLAESQFETKIMPWLNKLRYGKEAWGIQLYAIKLGIQLYRKLEDGIKKQKVGMHLYASALQANLFVDSSQGKDLGDEYVIFILFEEFRKNYGTFITQYKAMGGKISAKKIADLRYLIFAMNMMECRVIT